MFVFILKVKQSVSFLDLYRERLLPAGVCKVDTRRGKKDERERKYFLFFSADDDDAFFLFEPDRRYFG